VRWSMITYGLELSSCEHFLFSCFALGGCLFPEKRLSRIVSVPMLLSVVSLCEQTQLQLHLNVRYESVDIVRWWRSVAHLLTN
jgi:hypothetical protein